MTPKVSILVPIYNVADSLPKCLSSLIDQTLQEIEILCIDDGSTDDSPRILARFAKKDPRIRILTKKNSGYGDSMNRGIKQARGEYIGILEPDDWADPGMFQSLYRAARQHHADVVKSNYYRTRINNKTGLPINTPVTEIPDLRVIIPTKDRDVFRFAPAIWSAIYRRDFLIDNKITFLPTPGASYQDLSFNFKVWTLARRAVLLPEPYVHYRIDNANSSVNNPGKVNCVVDEYAEIETFLCERGIFDRFGETMNVAKFRNYHWNFQRLAPALAREFYDTWRSDLLSASDEGLLSRDQFSRRDWLALRTIIKHPRLAYRILRLRASLKR